VPTRFDTLLPGAFPVSSKYVGQGGPLVENGHVYWTPGDSTLKRFELAPGAQVDTIYAAPKTSTNPNPDVILKAVEGGIAYFLDNGSVLRPFGIPGKAPDNVPTWTSDIVGWNLSLNHWLVHEPIIWAGQRVYTGSGVLDETNQPLPYVDGTCVRSPDRTRVVCVDVELEFGTRAQHKVFTVSDKGASNLGVQTSNASSWFIVDGDASFEGPWVIHRVPFGGGADEVVASGTTDGTWDIKSMATDAYLYILRGCHELTTVALQPPFPAKTKELMLSADGPCVAFLHMDGSYAYLNTARGLVRIAQDELRRSLR
jgi:hypothetical protein